MSIVTVKKQLRILPKLTLQSFGLLLGALVIQCSAINLHAQTLEELIKEDGNSLQLENPNFSDDDKWIPPNSNFAFLFKKNDKGAFYLLEWLGEIATTQFYVVDKRNNSEKEFVALDVVYKTAQGTSITMNVMVPHPKHREMVELRLIPRFNDLEPPTLRVTSFEKMKIRNNECFIYRKKVGGISLLCKLPVAGVLNLYSEHDDDFGNLVTLAETMNISRLKQKLES